MGGKIPGHEMQMGGDGEPPAEQDIGEGTGDLGGSTQVPPVRQGEGTVQEVQGGGVVRVNESGDPPDGAVVRRAPLCVGMHGPTAPR